MGYACPVCGVEQLDGVHLANHLAVTASVGRADHRAWLDEHAPEWADCGPEELASRVVEFAPEIETPDVDGDGRAPDLETELAAQSTRPGRGGPVADRRDDAVESVLAEARELTERMARDDESDADPAELDSESDVDPVTPDGDDGAESTGEENG